MKKYCIAITGVTGLLGRNILFEYLSIYSKKLEDLKIIIIGRSSQNKGLRQRIKDIILEDGRFYLNLSSIELSSMIDYLSKSVEYVEIDFNYNICSDQWKILNRYTIDVFYHAAANTSLNNNSIIEQIVYDVNIGGTKQILNLINECDVKRLCYFSSVYSTGKLTDVVKPEEISMNRLFRNPYEYSKQYCEQIVREYKFKRNTECYIIRTSILCGRLIENKIGQIHKFDTLYGLASFFVKSKESILKNTCDIYEEPLDLNIRIVANQNSKVNIIPADFAAKASIAIMSLDDIKYKAFHLANEYECNIMGHILNYLHISSYHYVDSIPNDLNEIERLYYKSVGKIFTPYLENNGELYFDMESLNNCLPATIKCPKIGINEIEMLFSYARVYNFGLRNKII